MDRRGFVGGAAALAAIATAAHAGTYGLRSAARAAWLYGLPLIEMASARTRLVGGGAGTPGLNSFAHQRDLAGPQSLTPAIPDPDVLYSSAWLDLSRGPAKITVPAVGDRYFSLALMDMYTNNFDVVSGLEIGRRGGSFTLVAPVRPIDVEDFDLPRPHMPHLGRAIRTPGPWVWALARTAVAGPDDLAAAHAAQDGLAVAAHPPARAPRAYAGPDADWSDYFFAIQRLIEENPPPKSDNGFFHSVAPLQLGAAKGFETARFADLDLPEIAAGVADARASLASAQAGGVVADGWIFPRPDLGGFGQDYACRAAVAHTDLGAAPPAEVLRLRAVGADGRPVFDGEGSWRLSLPGSLPVDGFWSLALYAVAPDGRLSLADNPLGRYAVGDRTAGLRRGADGGVDIWVGRRDPGGDQTSNWLPAPAQGPFALALNAYRPRGELLDGRYRPPPLRPLAPLSAATG